MRPPSPRDEMQRRTSNMAKRHSIPRVLLLVETSRQFGRQIVEGIARYSLEHGPWSIQFEERGLDSSPPKCLKNWRGDGVISRTTTLALAKMLWASKLPMVELLGDRRVGTAQVRADFHLGGRMAMEHFLNCGLRHFGYFSYGDNWWSKIRREMFCAAVESRGCQCLNYEPPISTEANLPAWSDDQRPRLVKWLASLPRPIGIFTTGDVHAVRLLSICQELDIAVPEEIAILGVGNDPVICETVRPTLSSIDQDGRRVGYEAAHLLDQKMAGMNPTDVIHVAPSRVVVRQSTDLTVIEDTDVVLALRFIREFACSGIDVARVADEVSLSRRVLEQRFRQCLGRTPKAEIMRVQIEHAKTLLARTGQTNESISRKSGFASLPYFTTAFRREVGMTPNAYRREQRISRDSEDLLESFYQHHD
jgi:LacI family transcriptional regulator